MNILIVGLGSIGRRHLRNVRLLKPESTVAVWRLHNKDIADIDPETVNLVDQFIFEQQDVVAFKPDVAIIASHAPLHIEIALQLVEIGAHIFVEKPLSINLNDVNNLLDLVQRRKRILMVGYCLRFHRPIAIIKQALVENRIGRIISFRAEVGQYLPDWRPTTDYRKSVTAQKKLGGGVLFEISHEIDYAYWFIGEICSVQAQIGCLGDLEIDVEDVAEMIVCFENRAIGSIHLDMLQRTATRYCRIVGTEGTIVWEMQTDHARLFSVHTQSWIDLHPPQPVDRNLMYIEELRHFFTCVDTNQMPITTGEQAKHVLQVVLGAFESAKNSRQISIAS